MTYFIIVNKHVSPCYENIYKEIFWIKINIILYEVFLNLDLNSFLQRKRYFKDIFYTHKIS